MRSVVVKVLLVPIVCAMVATVLVVAQGGYGGGHGRFDLPIFCLGLPATLLGESWRLVPDVLNSTVFSSVVWIPAVVNLFAIWLPIALATSYFVKRRGR